MCDEGSKVRFEGQGQQNPAQRLSDLIQRELGVFIHPTAIRIFLRHNRRLVEACHHAMMDHP